jgi:hypothetical protein
MRPSKNLERVARAAIVRSDDLPALRQGRPEMRILLSDVPKRCRGEANEVSV